MLEIKNLKKSYDGVTILHDINLNIEDGEIVSILGPSGCGKTTLLNLILGFTDADEGEIIFQGQNVLDIPMEARGFNIVFQDYALFPNMNVYKNITYGFFYPADKNYTFQEMYQYIKERGYAIYPGKVTDAETFRIGNIGEIYEEDINKVCDIIEEFVRIKRAAA